MKITEVLNICFLFSANHLLCNSPLLPSLPFYGHQFLWPLAPVAQTMLRRVIASERDRHKEEENLALNTT